MSEQNCLFCKIVGKQIPAKIVYEDADVVAFEDINPQAPTHILLVPRVHVATLDALEAQHGALVGTVVLRAAAIARERHLNDSGYRLVVNCGEGAGQSVFHVHVHLLGGRGFGWPPG